MYSLDRYKSTIGFVDLLFNILVGFVFLFLVAFLMINPVAKKAEVVKKAEFLVTMTWNKNSLHDIDLWVMDPQGNKTGFANKQSGLLHLERDDLGVANDVFTFDGETIMINNNEETITVRGIMPGDYYVSVFWYSKQRNIEGEQNGVPVTVKVVKINPYKDVYTQQKVLQKEGSTENFFRFTVYPDGGVGNLQSSDVSAVGSIPKFEYRNN